MKKLITLILILVFSQVNAAKYYFSQASGDDTRTAAQAQNPATPWKSLTKAQTVFTTGNELSFQRGEVWYGSLVAQGSGTSGTRVIISAYGTGAKPIITGFSNISAWTNTGGNIWESTSAVSTLSTCNIASIGGANYSQGRTPNSGYYTINSTNGTSTIVSSSLNAGTINWTGAQVVMRKYRWIMDKYTVTSASGSTINFTSSGDAVQANYGFFLINDVRTLDQANEWSYSSSTKKMSIYKTSTPTNVKVPTVAIGINLNGNNYITIDNIDFQGFNDYGVYGTANDYINITNCNFSFIGNSAGYLYVSGSSSETCNFTGNTLSEIGSMGFHMGYANNTTVSSNTLLRIGRYAGMGQNGDVSYCGIVNWGDNQITSLNNVKAAGYCGIRFDGNSALINRNLVDSTNFVKDDGGGIYVYPQQTGPSSTVTYLTRTVSENIVLNTLGAIAGGEPTSDHDEGYAIYNDGTSPDVDYINNTIHNSHYGFFSNAGKRNKLQGNTLYNCKRNIFIVNYNSFGLNNWTITGNTSVAKFADQYVLYTEPKASTLPATWVLNNNCYARPIADNTSIWYDADGANNYVTLAQWKASAFAGGEDAASTKAFKAVSTTNDLLFVYNATGSTVNKALPAKYANVNGGSAYNGMITLAPYSSAVLVKTGNIVLPTRYKFLKASVDGKKFMWQTLEEDRTAYFVVQESGNAGRTWKSIAQVKAVGPSTYTVTR